VTGNRPTLLLALGAAVGIACAAIGLLRSGAVTAHSLPRDAVAMVNGQVIRLDEYQRVVTGLGQDRRSGADAAARQHVLDRLIEEELLVQRGLELGFARQDTKLRKDLSSAVIDSIVAEYDGVQPTDAELRSFYDQQRAFFTRPGHLRVRQIWCRVINPAEAAAALARAQQAARRLRAGEDFTVVRQALGDSEIAPLPDALLPVAKLADYLGATALRTVLSLDTGEVGDPVRSNTGYHVLQVIERKADSAPSLDEIKPEVIAEFRRRAADQALRTYLDDLRRRADVVVTPQLP
jgi:parvulin-like peptidyl-prolyl isomerase